MTNIKMLGVFV